MLIASPGNWRQITNTLCRITKSFRCQSTKTNLAIRLLVPCYCNRFLAVSKVAEKRPEAGQPDCPSFGLRQGNFPASSDQHLWTILHKIFRTSVLSKLNPNSFYSLHKLLWKEHKTFSETFVEVTSSFPACTARCAQHPNEGYGRYFS